MSDLHKFLQDWLDAATTKQTNPPEWYDDSTGLCTCAYRWVRAWNRPGADEDLRHRLKEDFGDAYNYPFGGMPRFDRDRAEGTMHLNKERLEWVRKVLAEKAENDGAVWGPEIDIDRKPDWLKDTDVCAINQGGAWLGQSGVFTAGAWNWLTHIKKIKLLADHAYYTVQRHNDRIGASFTYWGGQGDKPDDYDGGRVLLRTGTTANNSDDRASWSHPCGKALSGAGDIIGYTRKVEDKPVWGAVIDVEVVRERPDWLKASDTCDIKDRGIWTGGCGRFKASEWLWHKDVTQIKLLADHAYYKVHGTSYTYWGGQGDKPADWDGSDVVLRNGRKNPSPFSWSHPWREGDNGELDVIGYTRKADDLKDFLTEWLECATSDREGPLWFNRGVGLCQCARDWDAATGRDAHGPLREKFKEEFTGARYYPFGGMDRYFEDRANMSSHQNPERLAWVRKTLGLTPPSEDTVAAEDAGDAYGALRGILDEAYNQSAKGKGLERHGNGKAWTEQPILAITRDTGIGFPTGQAIKKVTEAVGMLGRGEGDAAARELLGAIVYTAAAIHFIREG